MNKRIRSIGILSAGYMMGALYAAIGLLFALIMVPFAVIAPMMGARDTGTSVVVILIFAVISPILYGILGFLGGAFMALSFNVVAKLTGGLELQMEDVA